jgi:hypothetical protein
MPQMGNPMGDMEGEEEGTPRLPLDSQRQLCEEVLKKLQLPPARHRLRPAVHVELAIDVL